MLRLYHASMFITSQQNLTYSTAFNLIAAANPLKHRVCILRRLTLTSPRYVVWSHRVFSGLTLLVFQRKLHA